MLRLAMEFLALIKDPRTGIIVVSISAIAIAGMAIYGMTLALKRRL